MHTAQADTHEYLNIILFTITPLDQYPLISDDLVNSHYLLLCCVNMLYTAAILNKRTDLVNTTFPDIPEWFTLTDSSPPSEFSSMLPDLCRRFNGMLSSRGGGVGQLCTSTHS